MVPMNFEDFPRSAQGLGYSLCPRAKLRNSIAVFIFDAVNLARIYIYGNYHLNCSIRCSHL